MNSHTPPGVRVDTNPPRAWRWLIPGACLVAGVLGTLVGIVPWLNTAVLGTIGRKESADFVGASPLEIVVIVVAQLGAFMAAFWLLRKPILPRQALLCVSLVYVVVAVAAWWPTRWDYLNPDFATKATSIRNGGAPDFVRVHGKNRDEAREFSVTFAIRREGIKAFFRPEALITNARQQHPPTIYWLLAQIPFHPVSMRAICLAMYVLGTCATFAWLGRVSQPEIAIRGALALVSASGLFAYLGSQASLDVFVFVGALAIPYCFFPRADAPGESLSLMRLVALGGLLATLMMLKFTVVVLVVGLGAAILPAARWRTTFVVAPPALACILYHIWLANNGEPFANTFVGDYYNSITTGAPRYFQGGGFVKSLISLIAFVLGPLCYLMWLAGLSGAAWRMLKQWRDAATPGWQISMVAVTSALFVYLVHPLFRYLTPAAWAIGYAIGLTYCEWRRGRLLSDSLIAAAASYGLLKLMVDSYV